MSLQRLATVLRQNSLCLYGSIHLSSVNQQPANLVQQGQFSQIKTCITNALSNIAQCCVQPKGCIWHVYYFQLHFFLGLIQNQDLSQFKSSYLDSCNLLLFAEPSILNTLPTFQLLKGCTCQQTELKTAAQDIAWACAR